MAGELEFWRTLQEKVERWMDARQLPIWGKLRRALGPIGDAQAEVAAFEDEPMKAETVGSYGLAVWPPPDVQCIITFGMGSNGQPIVTSTHAPGAPDDLAEGEVAVWTQNGGKITLRANGNIEVKAASGASITLQAGEAATAPVVRVGDSVAMEPLLAAALTTLAGVPAVAAAAPSITAAVAAGTVGTIATGSSTVQAS